jgi:hypothetical protein
MPTATTCICMPTRPGAKNGHFSINGRQREMGLGSARLETKRAAARADAARKTFGQVADEYIEAHSPKWSNAM